MTDLVRAKTAIAEGAILPKELMVGDTVYRYQYLDDGTWDRLGDVCLTADSPVMKGVIISRYYNMPTDKRDQQVGSLPSIFHGPSFGRAFIVYDVKWETLGTMHGYFASAFINVEKPRNVAL